jgi:hypothetical protein
MLVLLGAIFRSARRSNIGEALPIMPRSYHVAAGEDPGRYSTGPPTSSPHYNVLLKAGFYDKTSALRFVEYPEGYLVHNLEHGYIVFLYNCADLDEAGCSELNAEFQEVLNDAHNFKVIAFPWLSIDVHFVLKG